MENLNFMNGAIGAAVIAIGTFLKEWLKDKKIKNFELKRLLPILVFIVAEVLNIVYGLTTGENIVVSFSNGVTSTFIAVFGYDVYKSVFKKGNKEE